MSSPLLETARAIIAAAAERGADLRLFGSLAVVELCGEDDGAIGMSRDHPPRDIDFVARSAQVLVVRDLLADLGFQEDPDVTRLFGLSRRTYDHLSGAHIDVCLDVLRFCRDIDVSHRLGLRRRSLAVSDLLLGKLQIRHLTEGDIVDCARLLATFAPDAAEVGDHFDAGRVAGLCAADWGLYRLVRDNLFMVGAEVGKLGRSPMVSTCRARVDELVRIIEDHPKGLRFRARATIGPHLQWWRDVGEGTRVR